MKKIRLFRDISGWLIVLVVMLASCHTEKQTQRQFNKVLNDPIVLSRVGAYWQYLHPCINDTTTKTNIVFVPGKTVTKHDTTIVNGVVYVRDSIFVHDTTFQDRNHYITDTRQVNQLRDSLSQAKRDYADLQSAGIRDREQFKQDLSNEQANTKTEKKEKNGWKLKFWLAIAGGVIAVFRKPIFGLLKLI